MNDNLNQNDPICDLSSFDLNSDELTSVLDRIRKLPNIGLIKWHVNTIKNHSSLVQSIEAELIAHNEQFSSHPSDYIHLMLSSHCFNSVDNLTSNQFKDEYQILFDQQWKIEQVFHFDTYLSVLYSNDLTKKLVLAFQGVKLKTAEFFHTNEQLNDLYSIIASKYVVPQMVYAYLHLKSAVDLLDKNKLNYSLSFTGYALGAWLAQYACYIAITEFKLINKNIKVITFDSPGSFNQLNELYPNVVNYLTAPNFVNCYGKHTGKSLRLFISQETESFCTNALISLFSNGLDSIISEFDSLVGKPINCDQITEWPEIRFELVNEQLKNKINDSIDFHKLILQISKKNKLFRPKHLKCFHEKSTFKQIASSLMNNLIVLINFIFEMKSIDLSKRILFEETDFRIELNGECKLVDYNLYQDILVDKKEGSIDCLLLNLFHWPNRLHTNQNLNVFIQKQLRQLRRKYKIEDNETRIYSNEITIETIRMRLSRLIQLDEKNIHKSLIINSYLLKSDVIERFNTNVLVFNSKLNELKQLLNEKQYVYLQGVSGSGKSTLAAHYAKLKQKEEKIIIKWIDSADLLRTFLSMSSEFNIQLNYNQNTNNYWIKLFQKLKKALNEFTKRNELNVLFIVDNLVYLENDETLNDFKYLTFGFNSNFKFLITTKNLKKHLAKETTSGAIQLEYLGLNESLEFVSHQISQSISQQEWSELYELIKSKLPINLDKFVSVLNNHTNWKFKDMKIYLENELNNSYYFLLQENRKAFDLLSYMAYLNGDNISFNLIKKLLINSPRDTKQKSKEDELVKNLNYLIQLSEISKTGKWRYAVNELTQIEVLKRYLLKENKEIEIINRIVECLNESMPSQMTQLTEQNVEMFEHSAKILKLKWKDQFKSRNYIELKTKVAFIYRYIFKKNRVALNYYENLLSQDCLGVLETVLIYVEIGDLFLNQNDFTRALDQYEIALRIQIKSMPVDHHETGNTYYKIGFILDQSSDYKKAINYYMIALRIYIECNDKLGQSKVYNNVGLIYGGSSQGEFTKALDFFEHALNIEKEAETLDHSRVAATLNNIAGVYYNQGNYSEALNYFEQVLNIQHEMLGYNDPNLALIYNNIGGVYDSRAEYTRAIFYFEKALQIETDAWNHLNIAYCFINLAGVYLNRCEIETALDYFNRALIIQKEYLPPNHLDIALCLKNIAGCYQKSLNINELNKVHDYLKEAIKIESKKALHFKHNLDLAISYNNMASVYYHKKEFAKALEYNEKSFRMNNGLSTPEVGHFLNNTGLVYKTQYKYDQAFDLYSKALKHWQSVLPINHPNGAVVSNNIGCAFASVAAQDQNDEQANKKALEYLESALAISKETLQFDHTNIAITYYNIVQVYELILTKKKSKLKLT